MNDKFDQLAKNMSQTVTRALLCLALAAPFAWPARANDFQLGPLVLLSSPDPLAGCNNGGTVLNHTTRDAAAEAYIAVNPANPDNIVASWIAHDFHGNVAGVTFDGGATWRQVIIPGVSRCTAGSQPYSADPWLSFAPNGVIYSLNIGWGSSPSAFYVSKSSDGGQNWSGPTAINSGDGDKGSISADPTNPSYAYAIWA